MKLLNINVFTDAPNDSTSFYRAWGVFNQIRKRTDLPLNLLEEPRFGWNTINKFDLCYMHRANSQDHLDAVTICKKNNIPVWVDYDDDLVNIPKHNPAYRVFSDKKDKIKDILSLADVITVSTQALKDNYIAALQAGGSKIEVVENFVPFDNLPFNIPQKRGGKFRILWRGSNTHEMDWIVFKDAFIAFLKLHPDKIKFINIGDMPMAIKMEIAQYCEVENVQGRRLIDYLLWLRTGVADCIFVPLEDIPFNAAKSDIAVQEGLIGGMDAVCPKWNSDAFYAYENVQEATDMLDSVYTDWHENYEDYKKGIVRAQNDMKEKYQQRFDKRLNILKNILKVN